MDIGTITLLIVAGISFLLLVGVPLAFATGGVAVATAFTLVAVPIFILMATLLEQSGVTKDLFRAMHLISGWLKGGLGPQTLRVAVILAAMTGIIRGEIVLLGLLALPWMLARGYDRKLAIGIVCAGGSPGSMIPPSLVLIIYGLTVGVSIGDLLAAALLPGMVQAGLYVTYVLIRCQLDPTAGSPARGEELEISGAEKARPAFGLVLPLLVIVWVLGSNYAGIASVSGAAAMGVIGAGLSALVRGELTWTLLRGVLFRRMAIEYAISRMLPLSSIVMACTVEPAS